MYGTREYLCKVLVDNYPPDEPLALLVWTEAGIKELATDWNQTATEKEVRAVLERIGQMSDEDYQVNGVSADNVADMLAEVKADMREVAVPADMLGRLVVVAEQALWQIEWQARDEGMDVPELISRKLTDVGKVRDLLKS